jgi:predicted ATP-grasp superfamily ATP-dependent carboligase
VLPSCSVTTRFLTAYGCHLRSPRYPVPSLEAFDILDDKWRFAGLCAKLGIRHPSTQCFNTIADVIAAATSHQFTFPQVIKPVDRSGSWGVKKINTANELPTELSYRPILVQEFVPGQELCGFFLCREGQIITSVVYTGGDSRRVVFIQDEEIEQKSKIIIEHFGYNGLIGFDVLRSQDGELVFIECNPRFWNRMDLALIAGLNFVEAGCLGYARDNRLPGTITVPSRRGLARVLATPWRLSRYDIATLHYIVRDPLPNFLNSGLGGRATDYQAASSWPLRNRRDHLRHRH